MEIKLKDLPLLLFSYFGTVSPYFLGLYLFNKEEFLFLDLWKNILLCISYSFPVIYMNLFIEKFEHILKKKGSILNHYHSDIINVCIKSAHQQHFVLIFCIIFFSNDTFFRFPHYRNSTWLFTSLFVLFLAIKVIIKERSNIKSLYISLFTSKKHIGKDGE